MNKKVLIVCYSFPPFPGIGGRRWAKFAKYFANEGVQCHVINAHNYRKTQSLWTKDAENPNIIIHPLKFRFQFLMGLNSGKWGYRVLAKLLRTAINFTKYSPYFSTSLSRNCLLKKCKKLIQQHNIDTVIASGDPYLQYYITGLKKECHVRVILDYRDLWNDFSYYNQNKTHSLTSRQRKFFEFSENESLKNCDKVVCVYEPMIQLLSARSGKSQEYFYVIPNGFDKDDYPKVKPGTLPAKKITLYFGGSVDVERGKYFRQFLQAYSQLRNSPGQLWERFYVEIDGIISPAFENDLEKLNDPSISLKKEVLPVAKYLEKLIASDFCILPVHDDYADNCFSTKAYDYLYMEKQIIYLGKKGKVSEFIEQNGLGFYFNPAKKTELFFQKLLNVPLGFPYPAGVRDEIKRKYDVGNISLQYLDLLNQRWNGE